MKVLNSIKIILLVSFSILGLILSINFPDLDISIFGIGLHRFFLFHSAIIPLLLFILSKITFKLVDTIEIAAIGFLGSFSIGIGIHLFTDIFQTKAIIFPFIGSLVDGTSLDDRIWIAVNILVCLLVTILLYKKASQLLGFKKPLKETVSASKIIERAIESDLNKIKRKIRSEFEVYVDSKGEYRFRLKAPNGEVILMSESYSSKSACLNGIKVVKKYSATAVIEEVE